MSSVTISAIAHALPTGRIGHAELVERFGEKAMRSIARMSGITERRVAPPGQCASDLAEAAVRRLLDRRAIDPADIDLLIFTSQTPDYRSPATASILLGRLGIDESCAAFDINQACAGYIHALQVGHALLASGQYRRALLLNADVLTQRIHPKDQTMVPLTGDGAVATLLESIAAEKGGFEFFRIGNDGSQYHRLFVPAGGARMPSSATTATPKTDAAGVTRSLDDMHMDGPAVFHFAVYKVAGFIKDVLAEKNIAVADFDTILLHQANKTMIDLIYKSIGAQPSQQFSNLQEVGNLAAASLPCLLSQAWREKIVKPGSRTLLCGFGGGLSWGLAVIRWPEDADAAIAGDVDVPFVPADHRREAAS